MTLRLLAIVICALTLAACSPSMNEGALDPRSVAAVRLDPQAAVAQLNAYRESKGLAPVRLDASLNAMAQHQADVMAASGQLSHTVGGAFATRLSSENIDAGEAGENLGAGYLSLGDAMAGWKGSREHDANMLRPGFTRVGVAIAKNARTSWGVYWAMDFAGERAPRLETVGLLGSATPSP